jgi:hypothetical protein
MRRFFLFLILLGFSGIMLFAQESRSEWFTFDAPDDSYTNAALLDLRSMSPERAGTNGWIVNREGWFAEEDTGKKVRFLAVNGPVPWGRGKPFGSPEKRRKLAALLSKRGVNLMRIGPVRGAHKMNDDQVQGFLDLVEAGAEYGIYTGVCFFFPYETIISSIPGYEKKGAGSLVYFHPEAKRAYFELLEKLVHTPDNKTGKALTQNKAVAYIEIINEDNLFFHTYKPSKMPSAVQEVAEKQYGAWLMNRYGGLEEALAAWGGDAAGRPRDNPAEGRMELHDASSFMDADWAWDQRDPERAVDQLRYMVELQMNFFNDVEEQLRQWGYKGCVLATNWKTVSPRLLNALDKYTNTTGDMLDRHAYFNTPHENAKHGNSIKENGIYASDSALNDPLLLIAGVEYKGYPEILSEYQYPAPNQFRAESVWLGAHYGALLDIDGFSFNEIHAAEWQNRLRVFNVLTPLTTQQFPAAAYVYRNGLIQTAEPVAEQTLNPEDLIQLRGSAFWDQMNIDELRAGEIRGDGQEIPEALDPFMWMVGPVRIGFGEETLAPEVMNLDDFIDREEKTIRSRTGELKWDYGRGVVTADAPGVQSACGFLSKAGTIELSQCTIEIENRYASLWIVALDGKSVSESEKILVQIMTEERPTGWEEEPAMFTDKEGVEHKGHKILKSGGGGWQIRSVMGRIRFKRSDASNLVVTPLDANFYARGKIIQGAETLELLPDCLHYIIHKGD